MFFDRDVAFPQIFSTETRLWSVFCETELAAVHQPPWSHRTTFLVWKESTEECSGLTASPWECTKASFFVKSWRWDTYGTAIDEYAHFILFMSAFKTQNCLTSRSNQPLVSTIIKSFFKTCICHWLPPICYYSCPYPVFFSLRKAVKHATSALYSSHVFVFPSPSCLCNFGR